MDEMKICSKCDFVKELTELSFRKYTQKYRSECIQCSSIKQKEWRDNNPEKVKQNQKKYNEKKQRKKETYISKTNEKQMLDFV